MIKKKIGVLLSSLAVVMGIAFSCPTVADAAENDMYEYRHFVTTYDSTWNWEYIRTSYPLYGFINQRYEPATYNSMSLCLIEIRPDKGDGVLIHPEEAYGVKTTSTKVIDVGVSYLDIGAFTESGAVSWLGSLSDNQSTAYTLNCTGYTSTIPIFTTASALYNYLSTGDESGWLNKPEIEYSMEHDFSADIFSPDIPLPELNNITYNGFVVDNNVGYEVDVLVETKFYGVKHAARDLTINNGVWDVEPNKAWLYGKGFYNLSNDVLSDVTTDSHINIADVYGIDITGGFIEKFKEWSATYPTSKTLPDYSWTKMGGVADDNYLEKHVYKDNSDLTDLEQLEKSAQAEVSYYVRFRDSAGICGQWAKYTYRSKYEVVGVGVVQEGNLITGVVDVNTNGEVYIKDTVIGSVDSDGSIDYSGIDNGSADASIDGFMDALDAFTKPITKVVSLLKQMFSFLPWWATSLMGLAVFAVVSLRFLGR